VLEERRIEDTFKMMMTILLMMEDHLVA